MHSPMLADPLINQQNAGHHLEGVSLENIEKSVTRLLLPKPVS